MGRIQWHQRKSNYTCKFVTRPPAKWKICFDSLLNSQLTPWHMIFFMKFRVIQLTQKLPTAMEGNLRFKIIMTKPTT